MVAKWSHWRSPRCSIPGVPATRGASFEHRNGDECTDRKFDRHCVGRCRGSVSLGFDADGKRIRRRVTGSTKTAVVEAMAELCEELGRAPWSSRTYTVAEAVAASLEDGLPGRSERTKAIYKHRLAPLLAKIGHRPLRELTAVEVRKGLEGLSGQLSTPQPADWPERAGAGPEARAGP